MCFPYSLIAVSVPLHFGIQSMNSDLQRDRAVSRHNCLEENYCHFRLLSQKERSRCFL